MKNIRYSVEGKDLTVEFTSKKMLYEYALFLQREDAQFYFQAVEHLTYDAYDYYKFACSLNDFAEFLNKNKELLWITDEDDSANDQYKFMITAQYLKYDKKTDSNKPIEKIVKVSKKGWQFSNLNHVTDENNGNVFVPYITKQSSLALLVNKDLSDSHYFLRKTISKVKVREGKLFLEGNLTNRFFDIESGQVEFIQRGGEKSVSFPARIKLNKEQKVNSFTRRHVYQIEVQMKDLVEFLSSLEQKEELTIDLYFILKLKNTDAELRFKIGNPRFLTRYFLKGEMAFFSERNQGWLSLVPYFTIKGNNLSFNYNVYDKEAYGYFRNNKNHWRAISKAGKNRNIWIIGERSYKAQDNGYRFFKYLRKKHPEVEAYYVISKDSPEREHVTPFGNVIDFYSKEHFQLVMQASYICGTHHPSHIYPTRNKQYVKNIKAKKVFLQHGVFGTKNISPFYGKWLPDFETDMFVTSSEKEKNIAIRDLGYEQDEVAVTGLSRFESLFQDDVALKRQV